MSDFLALQEYIVKDINSIKYIVKGIIEPIRYKIIKLVQKIRIEDIFSFRQVPAGAASGYATIEKIEGNTVKFNQLVQNGDFSQAALLNSSAFYSQNGSVTYEDKLTFTCSTSSTASKGYYAPVSSLTIGHRYVVCATLSKHTGDNTNWVLVGFSNDAASVTPIDSNISYDDDVEFLAYSITELPVQCDKVGVRIRNFSPAGATLTAKNLNIIDLTAIFTSGNEPDTMDEFVSWCTQNGIDIEKTLGYNAGELLSVKMSGMQTTLANQNMFVDMGLPSGLLWASSNIDITQLNGLASSPFQYDCSFFSWGNVDGYNPISNNAFDYNWGSINAQSPWYEGQPYGDTAGSALTSNIPINDTYDAARKNVHSLWRVPSSADFQELINNCDFLAADGTTIPAETNDKRVTYNGVMGIRLKSKINGNELFFACCGYGSGTSRLRRGTYGFYITRDYVSDKAFLSLSVLASGINESYVNNRYSANTIRPVISPTNLDIDVTTITGINSITNVREVIFSNGMNWLSDSIHDVIDLVNGTAVKNCLVEDLGNFNYVNDTIQGKIRWNTSTAIPNSYNSLNTPFFILNYTRSTAPVAGNGVNMAMQIWYRNLYFRNDDYTSYTGTQVKTALTGTKLIYQIATPITYTDLQDANGNLLKNKYKVESGGTEQILPINTNTPTTVSPKLTTTYTKK